MNAKNRLKLRKTLGSGPLTRSIQRVIGEHELADIHSVAAEMGYTRRAVNHALRKNGVKQNRSRKDKE